MFWVSYYLQKGHRLDYLLNLSYEEQIFFQKSMEKMDEEKVLYDIEKMKAFLKALGGDGNSR